MVVDATDVDAAGQRAQAEATRTAPRQTVAAPHRSNGSRRTETPSRLHTPCLASPQVRHHAGGPPGPSTAKLRGVFGAASAKGKTTDHVFAGHRLARLPEQACLKTASPSRRKRPLTRVSAGQGPFSQRVAGEGFEPSKLSRRIYSPLPLAARATCRRRAPRQVTTWSGRQQTKG